MEEKSPKDVLVMVEDSKSGYQFFSAICEKGACLSVDGNSNFVSKIESVDKDKQVVVIADGAAFGAYIAKVMAIAKSRKDVTMYFPERYIESRDFFSWERYFTQLLIDATSDSEIKKYDKSRLKPYYLEGKNKDSIIEILPESVRMLFET